MEVLSLDNGKVWIRKVALGSCGSSLHSRRKRKPQSIFNIHGIGYTEQSSNHIMTAQKTCSMVLQRTFMYAYKSFKTDLLPCKRNRRRNLSKNKKFFLERYDTYYIFSR